MSNLKYNWGFWGRPEQWLPTGAKWGIWLLLAGRGFGKTRTGCEAIRELVCGKTPLEKGKYGRIAIIGETASDARDVLVEGPSGLLAVHPPGFRPTYEPSKRRITWPNGAVASTYNATEPDQLRGPQHDLALCDELAKWQYAQETWDQLQFGMRVGDQPRQLVTTTPRPIPIIKKLVHRSDGSVVITRGKTSDNRSNLAASFISETAERYAGTRLGRQELEGEILDDAPGALWSREVIDAARMRRDMPEMQSIVVAIDPSGARDEDDEGADSIGIVVAGKGVDGRGYVLADLTLKASPGEWAAVAVNAYKRYYADRIVAERNFGGAMVEHTIRTEDANIPYREVTASRGKVVRAEPVAALYEQGKVSHVGPALAELEDQMCLMTREGFIGKGSPDRVDALVWALTDLMVGPEPPRALF